MADPLQWHMVHKTEWAKYLMSSEAPGSAAAKKEIVKAANRFMLWLHDRRPGEVPPLKFQPLTKAVLKKVTADRQTHGEARVPTMIKDEHWAIIRCKLPTSVKPFALLAYHYGLRRSETLGLELKDVKLGYLRVERQLETFADSTPSFGPLKGREARKVPHWFSTPSEVHDLITLAVSERVHPDTLTDRWTELMKQLGFTYTFHDLRHTWITKAIRTNAARDVQLAAGHKNIETTMRYSHDDRELDDEVFIPKAAS